MRALEQANNAVIGSSRRRGNWRIGIYPRLPFNKITPGLSCGIGFFRIRITRVGERVFISQVGKNVPCFMRYNLFARKTIKADDSLLESIGTPGADVVDEQDRKMAIRHERLQK